jgi:hypothetical protein
MHNKVVIIDEFLARKYWPKGNALGAKIRKGDDKGPIATIVGIAAV